MYLCASSARHRIAAAAPSLTPEQSNTPSIPATLGALSIFSGGTALWNWALGLRAPFAWFLQAMRVSTCRMVASSKPYFLEYAGASRENVAGAVMDDCVPSVGVPAAEASPEYPESLSFSTPIAMTRS